jgi:hypothetical protein
MCVPLVSTPPAQPAKPQGISHAEMENATALSCAMTAKAARNLSAVSAMVKKPSNALIAMGPEIRSISVSPAKAWASTNALRWVVPAGGFAVDAAMEEAGWRCKAISILVKAPHTEVNLLTAHHAEAVQILAARVMA